MKRLFIFYAVMMFTTGCMLTRSEPVITDSAITRAFLSNYEPYCGQAFSGISSFTDLGEDSPLQDASLTMIITDCAPDEIRIRFFVEDDTSRTWVLGYLEDGLRLAHDHRYADGSEYEANFYGGKAMENTHNAFEHYPEGLTTSTTRLFFPADARTLVDRPTRDINVWSKAFDIQNQTYFYRLYLRGELRYEATFDLSEPIELDSLHDEDTD